MKSIEELMKEEADILSRYHGNRLKDYSNLASDIKSLLDDISSNYKAINDLRELKWVYNAIIRWESFLISRFGIYVTTLLPSISKLKAITNAPRTGSVVPLRSSRLLLQKKVAMFGNLYLDGLRMDLGEPPFLKRRKGEDVHAT